MGYQEELDHAKSLFDSGALDSDGYNRLKENILKKQAENPGAHEIKEKSAQFENIPNPNPSQQAYQAPPNYNQASPNYNQPQNQGNISSQYGQQPYYEAPVNQSLRTAAFVLNLIATIILAFPTFGIGLAWGIPMTVVSYRIIRSPYKHTALGVCCIIFLGFISGILILCSGGRDKPTY